MTDLDRELTIFVISIVIFFICPVVLVVATIIVDQLSDDQSVDDQVRPGDPAGGPASR
jgi:hypothetical protein